MDAIEALHERLKFSVYEPKLRGVTGIWRQIETHRAAARRDAKALPAYEKYLERCIKQLQSEPDFTVEQTEEACRKYIELSARLYAELRIEDTQPMRRPDSWLKWTEKFLKPEYEAYVDAMALCEKTQNERTFTNLYAALENAMRAYAGAMK